MKTKYIPPTNRTAKRRVRKSPESGRFSFECLESRNLLAGDFFGSVNLTIGIGLAGRYGIADSGVVDTQTQCDVSHSGNDVHAHSDECDQNVGRDLDHFLDTLSLGAGTAFYSNVRATGRSSSTITGTDFNSGRSVDPPRIPTVAPSSGYSSDRTVPTPTQPAVPSNNSPIQEARSELPRRSGGFVKTSHKATVPAGDLKPISFMATNETEIAKPNEAFVVEVGRTEYFASLEREPDSEDAVHRVEPAARTGLLGHYQSFSQLDSTTQHGDVTMLDHRDAMDNLFAESRNVDEKGRTEPNAPLHQTASLDSVMENSDWLSIVEPELLVVFAPSSESTNASELRPATEPLSGTSSFGETEFVSCFPWFDSKPSLSSSLFFALIVAGSINLKRGAMRQRNPRDLTEPSRPYCRKSLSDPKKHGTPNSERANSETSVSDTVT